MRKESRLFNIFNLWIIFLFLLIVIGMIGGYFVFRDGLIITNLTDLVPWGLWITIDMSAIALSSGAFFFSTIVYILKIKKYEPLARTAVFIGLIGYSIAVLTLLFDLGQPFRFWHALIYWNPHSVLWEVTMCITLYLTVLVIENLILISDHPTFKTRFPKIQARIHKLHKYTPYVAVAGLILSSLHQSSLGAAYGVIKSKALWFRPGLASLYIISALLGGTSFTILVTMVSAKISSKITANDKVLRTISLYIGWGLIGYLYLRFWDVFSMTYTNVPGRMEGLTLLTSKTLAFNFWFMEIILGLMIPIVLLLNKRTRENQYIRILALLFVSLGVIIHRWNTNISGQLIHTSYLPETESLFYVSYTPSLIEVITSLGILSFGFLALTLGIKYLRIINYKKPTPSFE